MSSGVGVLERALPRRELDSGARFSDASYTQTCVSQQEPAGGNGFLGLEELRNGLNLVIKTSRTTDASPELLALAVSGLAGIGLA